MWAAVFAALALSFAISILVLIKAMSKVSEEAEPKPIQWDHTETNTRL
jgi:hypothetical protein